MDVSQLQYTLERAGGYVYRNVGFILDRGYFSKENIHYMDKCGYEFIIMMEGMKELVKSLILEVKGTFEEDRKYSIRDYKVSGIIVKKQLYPLDEKERYFHIFYSDRKKSLEHEDVEAKIDRMAECLHKHEGTKYEIKSGGFARYFVIITSEKMTAAQAKIFIEFVALIIRSRFYTCLKEQTQKSGKKNYMTVPAAISELEKIELIRQSDRGYRMDYAVTATQKEILKAFNMTAANIRTQAATMNEDLMQIEKEG